MKCPKCSGSGKVEFGTKTGNTTCFLCKGSGEIKEGVLVNIENLGFRLSDAFSDVNWSAFWKEIDYRFTAFFSFDHRKKTVKYFVVDSFADYYPHFTISHTQINDHSRKKLIEVMKIMKSKAVENEN